MANNWTHWQSGSRRVLNHWQSGGGDDGLIISFYMNGNYPYSAPRPTSDACYIDAPEEGVTQDISIDRRSRSSYQATLNQLSLGRVNNLYSLWYDFLTAERYKTGQWPEYPEGGKWVDRGEAFSTTYYDQTISGPVTGHQVASFMGLITHVDKIKMINLYVGGFYKKDLLVTVSTTSGESERTMTYSYFNDENTRTKFYGPIIFPCYTWYYENAGTPDEPNFVGHSPFSDLNSGSEAAWETWSKLISKIHIWVPYPSYDGYLLNPSVSTKTYTLKNSDGSISSDSPITTNEYQTTFYAGTSSWSMAYYKYHSYYKNYPMTPHIHLPKTYDPTSVATSAPYVYKYTHFTDSDGNVTWGWTAVPASGQFCRNILTQGPVYSGSIPSEGSEWYQKEFYLYEKIGEWDILYDIDISKTVEENMNDYVKQL